MNDIAHVEIEDNDVTIKLAKRDAISSLGIVRDVEVLCDKIKYPTNFLVLGSPKDDFCPVIFGRPFLNTVNAKIDWIRETVSGNFGDVSHEFYFSKFHRQPHDKELSSNDEIIVIDSIVVPPTDPFEQYLLDHENDIYMNERNK